MMFTFGSERPKRRPNLTPMIDVVFLLLVFFMLASQFGTDRVLAVSALGQGATYTGPPRLVAVAPGAITLNGIPVTAEGLVAELGRLTDSPSDTIILRATDAASLQDLVAVVDDLTSAGFTRLVLVE
jgi:biopolymer transport protein ExbD